MSTPTDGITTGAATAAAPVARVTGLTKDYGRTRALKQVDLDVHPGEIVVLLGLSGSGKSTLLRHLNGLERPSRGSVEVLDQQLASLSAKQLRGLRSRVAMIFQQFELVPSLTVLENVLTGALANLRGPRLGLWTYPRTLRRAALERLDRVGLLAFAHRRADQLSGGQQQRVAIARALMQNPKVLLADEPVASLDPDSSAQVMALIREIAQEEGLTVVCSLHQVDLALAWADRLVGLRGGEVVMDTPAHQLGRQQVMDIYRQVAPDIEVDAPVRQLQEA